MDRREFNQMAAMLTAAMLLPGCSCLPKDPEALFDLYRNNDDKNPLLDVHAHFFNGSDVQVKAFVSRVVSQELGDWAWLAKFFGPILQRIAWSSTIVPTAEKELRKLQSMQAAADKSMEQQLLDTAEAQFVVAKKAIERSIAEVKQDSANKHNVLEQLQDDQIDQISSLLRETEFSSYQAMQKSAENSQSDNNGIMESLSKFDLKGGLRFIFEMFQYRTTSALHYLKTYGGKDGVSSDKFDLMIHHIVDYDWWLNQGRKTPSSIRAQVDCFHEIGKISKQMVGYFVPFCPLRQAIWNKAEKDGQPADDVAGFNPIEMVKYAVEEKGALGVKLYPPMGFSLYDNEQLLKNKPDLWSSKSFLPPICHEDKFGERLDEALQQLYDYCQAGGSNNREAVPIMAHSQPSNMSHGDFSAVFDTKLWAPLFRQYQLTFNFGHFGAFDCSEPKCDETDHIWQGLFAIMKEHNRSGFSNVYADTGFFSLALNNPQEMRRKFEQLLALDHKTVSENLIYGSDWKMLMIQNQANAYLERFKGLLGSLNGEGLDKQSMAANILGRNAQRFLRLF